MNCEEIRERLDEYVDDELDPETRASVVDHIAACDACRSELARLQTTVSLVRGLPRESAPSWIRDGVSETIRQEYVPAPRPILIRRLWPVAAAATIALVIYVAAPRAPKRSEYAAAPAAGTEMYALKSEEAEEEARRLPASAPQPKLDELRDKDALGLSFADAELGGKEEAAEREDRLLAELADDNGYAYLKSLAPTEAEEVDRLAGVAGGPSEEGKTVADLRGADWATLAKKGVTTDDLKRKGGIELTVMVVDPANDSKTIIKTLAKNAAGPVRQVNENLILADVPTAKLSAVVEGLARAKLLTWESAMTELRKQGLQVVKLDTAWRYERDFKQAEKAGAALALRASRKRISERAGALAREPVREETEARKYRVLEESIAIYRAPEMPLAYGLGGGGTAQETIRLVVNLKQKGAGVTDTAKRAISGKLESDALEAEGAEK